MRRGTDEHAIGLSGRLQASRQIRRIADESFLAGGANTGSGTNTGSNAGSGTNTGSNTGSGSGGY